MKRIGNSDYFPVVALNSCDKVRAGQIWAGIAEAHIVYVQVELYPVTVHPIYLVLYLFLFTSFVQCCGFLSPL